MFEELAEERKGEILAGLPNSTDGRMFRNLETSVSVSESGDTVTGPASAVFPEVDYRTVEQVKFLFGEEYGRDGLVLTFSVKDWLDSAVVLSVRSTDTRWAKRAFATLSNEIEKDVPKWAVLKFPAIYGFCYLPIALALAAFGFGALVRWRPPAWSWPLSVMIFLAIIAVFLPSLSIRLFPRIEIRTEGSRSRGNRVFLALAVFAFSNLVALAIGIYVNAIS